LLLLSLLCLLLLFVLLPLRIATAFLLCPSLVLLFLIRLTLILLASFLPTTAAALCARYANGADEHSQRKQGGRCRALVIYFH